MTDQNPSTETKRGRGRPRIHQNGTTLFSLRVSTEHAIHLRRLITTIQLLDARCHDPDGAILIEALERRLHGLRNRDPVRVDRLLQ